METQKPPLIWLNIFIFSFSLLLALVATPWYAWEHGLTVWHALWFFVAFSFTNLSITAGYHRLWSHKTYEAHSLLRVLFAIGGAFSLQNSILHWSSDHRRHHRHVDDFDKDPYSASRGFWFSHIGWMLRHYNQESYSDYTNCRDLQKDPIVMWQHRYYVPLAIATNLGIPLMLGAFYQDYVGMLLVVGALRLVVSHHSTFFINSLAHIWGSQPFTDKNSARDNGILAIFTFGEGYHNFHHIFENDYRNGIYWWQYDPTKWLIKSCSWIGLTKRLRVTPQLKIDTAKAAQIFKMAKMKLEERAEAASLHEQLQREFDSLTALMKEYYEAKKQLLESKRQNAAQKYENALLTIRYKQLKADLAERYRLWNQFVEAYA
ncbi:acyl-CoA desaturase [Vibrio cidicii]|uniref:Acyl-CoA desaturase n=1 Tax=Vibrio cidicii TaxID=1763883 RepID=A0A151KV83_9VIBR|nr:fatty acid desaturase [Vibrio cidicii]EJN6829543.1 fatty acid desaturase [Vibrio cidicii]KYN80712.1 acyl-CoA desaturase [Vibrio cidicii]KYN86147.1 acyl-CoA desaturase [Vibrio cidicii]MBG0761560.1 acyl-CoA desaturase [Vibrio cidicii]